MTENILLAILLFFAIFHLTDQVIELTEENGNGKFISPAFFAPKQCYSALGESAFGSYRIQFRIVGKGHCQLLLCYPSQLDPNALLNRLEPEIGYYLPNNLESNPWIKQCTTNESVYQWHRIYVDVDGNIINLTLSFHDQSFPINARNFFLELANPSDSSLTTKLHIHNSDTKSYENKEFDEHIHQKFLGNQYIGAPLIDFAGFWALALDLLPSNLDQNKIKIFTLSSRNKRHAGKHDTCDVNSGNMVKDNCSIQAWFLEPSDSIIPDQIDENFNNNSCIMDKKLPFIDESFLENPLKIGDIIHITGRMNADFNGYFIIHLLHNWTEPDSIMGETILTIKIRRNYINFESRYNFTEHKPPSPDTISNIFGQTLDADIDKKFSLNIVADSNGNFRIVLNCKNEKAFIFTQANDNPLKYSSTNYIRIEADDGGELYCYQIIGKKESDIALPFYYILDKPLEIGSKIEIKMKFEVKNFWSMTIYLLNNASVFDEQFDTTNVLWLNISASPGFAFIGVKDILNVEAGRKIGKKRYENSTMHEFGKFFEFEIIVHEEYYQILADGMQMFNYSHMLLFGMVNFMRIEEKNIKGEIKETKITWPSDSSSNWLTVPGKKEIKFERPKGVPTKDDPLIMRLNRPLRINDTILFKGKFHNSFIGLYIYLLRDIPNKEKPFKIMDANLNYYPPTTASRLSLMRNEYDENGNLIENYMDDVDFYSTNDEFDVKIFMNGNNNFYVQDGNSTVANMDNRGLLWAVQYIIFRFRAGHNEEPNVEIEEGYPKIVHDYGK